MKYKSLLYTYLILMGFTQAIAQTITTQGNKIIDPCGQEISLRGINYAPFNWGYSPAALEIAEIEKTGANCVRLVWYVDAEPVANAVYQDTAKLAEVMQACIDNDLIPILELHDQTCENDPQAMITLASWYLQDDVFTVLQRFEHSLIINLFNEALYIDWTGDIPGGEATFIQTYSTIIQNLRSGGINVPLMIDGSECGTNIWSLTHMATDLIEADPIDNLIFSAHAYWHYVATTMEELDALIRDAASSEVPLVIGELANYQDESVACEHTLNYEDLAAICLNYDIGWMAWSWDNDFCADRQLTTDGQFDNLTPFGESIVYNSTFGLSENPPTRSSYLTQDGNCTTTSNSDVQLDNSGISLFPNPVQGEFSIKGILGSFDLEILDSTGSSVYQVLDNSQPVVLIDLSNLPAGLFFVRIVHTSNRLISMQKIIKQ